MYKPEISLEKLLTAGAHFGHQMRRHNPKMRDYMFASKEGIFVFDLIKTKSKLEEALVRIYEVSKSGEDILILGTKKQSKDKVEEVAKEVGISYIIERWLGGTFTNFDQIKRSIRGLSDLKEKHSKAKSLGYTKKERLLMDRKIQKMTKTLGGIMEIEKLPAMMIVIDTHKEYSAMLEAKRVGVETVGVCDSNGDPALVDWVIPMNDDAVAGVEYVLELIRDAVAAGKKDLAGKAKKTKKAKEE